MNLSTDRDLLSIEPDVFTDVSLISQLRVHTTDGTLSGTQLTSADARFAEAAVDAGSVALIGGTPLEVTERVDTNTLTVSLLRASASDDLIPPRHLEGSALEVKVRTFAPQAVLAHENLLRLLGVDPDGVDADALAEDAVISQSVMARLEALGTLDRVYTSAAAIEEEPGALAYKAAFYRDRFAAARERASVLLDVDGDGLGTERRRLGLIRLCRV